jgi:cellulose synthase/poly-beta-1,6-N-acetylglucosamine synthase-like glycosyltransferase
MPIRNEEKYIESTMQMILSQDYSKDNFEIIVADGNSSDETVNIIKRLQEKHPQIIIKNNPKLKSSAGRNIAFEQGQGDIFMIIDGHCNIPDDQLFNNTIKCFEKSGAECLGRPQPLSPPNISKFQQLVADARSSSIGHASNSLIYSTFEGFVSPQSHGATYKRSVVEKIHSFDESFDACEDVEFNLRVEDAGFKTFMSPGLTVKYYPRENLLALYKQMQQYGKGRIKLLKKHPQTFSIKALLPLFFISGLIANLLAIFFGANSEVNTVLIAPYILYLILISVCSLLLSRSSIGKNTFCFLFIFITIHAGLGVGQLKGMLLPKGMAIN